MNKFQYFLIGALVAILVGTSYRAGLFSGLENFFEDQLFVVGAANPEVMIISVDSESISRIGQWPWPRSVFGEALRNLDSAGPAVVGIDVIFSEPSRLGGADDLVLARSLDSVSFPVILPIEGLPLIIEGSEILAGDILKPLPVFTSSENVSLGHVNLIADKDGTIRRFPLSVGGVKAFSYEVAKRSGRRIPNESSLMAINRIAYRSPPGTIRRFPFWRLLEEDLSKQLAGKIILIGATAADLHDEAPTPLTKGTAMTGVEIQANILDMLLSGRRLASLPEFLNYLWIFLAAIVPAGIFLVFQGVVLPVLLNVALGFGYLAVAILLFNLGMAANLIHINFSWMLSTLSLFSYRYFVAEKEKRELKDVFSKYVSKDVLDEILSNPGKVKLGGEEREITVLFSDIRGFTALSESATPSELVEILNKYFTLMTGEILANGGVLDKYIGDAIMAFWGAPLPDPSQSENALKASLGMLENLKKLNEELKSKGKPEIAIGVGIYTGKAIVGNVGSDLRFDYTAIGDTVNVASRLESLNKEYGTNIIIGETSKNKISTFDNFKSLGLVKVKGRIQPLNIYTIKDEGKR
jgi:adenylate cyclase